jgi:hypothetical protein
MRVLKIINQFNDIRLPQAVILFIFILLSLSISAQQRTNRPAADTILFQLTDYNNIAVAAILNRQDTILLMFHTAANFLTLTEEAVAKLKSIQFNGTTDSIKSWGGQGNAARFSQGNTLQIAGLQWDSVTLWENKNSGQHTDGKFGIDLFNKNAIEIDFDKHIIVLHTGIPAKATKFEKLALRVQQENLFVEATCVIGKQRFIHPFLLHSGYSGALLLDDQFAAEKKLGSHLTITGEKQLKDSYGNIMKVKKAILPRLQLGKQILDNVPAGFFEGAIGRQKMSILGGDILKRFDMIIDSARTHLYIRPNRLNRIQYSNS